jgi:hypothetical protein
MREHFWPFGYSGSPEYVLATRWRLRYEQVAGHRFAQMF